MGRPRRVLAPASASCVKDFAPKDHAARHDASLGSDGVNNLSRLTVLYAKVDSSAQCTTVAY
jgi:hypothetical protein